MFSVWISYLAVNMNTDDTAKLKATILDESNVQGMEAVNELITIDADAGTFLISLLSSRNPVIRDRAALGLHELKDNTAVEHLFKAISRPENVNHRGTLVYALESMDCSGKLVEVFDLLFYGNAEVKMGAEAILDEQEFEFTRNDLLNIQLKWQQVQANPDLCPYYDDWKDNIDVMVEGYLAYLNQDASF
jgi:HEAT repeat protein